MKNIFDWLVEHWMEVLVFGFIIRWGGLLFDMLIREPLRGRDGHTSMDELAKYSLIVYLGLVLYWIKDASNEYPPEVVLYLVLGVAAIAGLKPLFQYLASKTKKADDLPPNDMT